MHTERFVRRTSMIILAAAASLALAVPPAFAGKGGGGTSEAPDLSLRVETLEGDVGDLQGQLNGSDSQHKRHPGIDEVFLNFDTDELLIVGGGFDFSDYFGVTLGASDNVGDVTDLCIADVLSQPQTILCAFASTGGLPPDGDYLLRVSAQTEKGKIILSDEHDLTIGAPQGETGAPGISGYEIVIEHDILTPLAAGKAGMVVVDCPSGKSAIGGVCATSAPNVGLSKSFLTFDPTGYGCEFRNFGSEDLNPGVAVSAICAIVE